ncbi:ABC transporter substrate-binding protein [Colwellia sp. RSH04]|uniref:substrate-binding periplasmic protein n=1 Tax=Colwellia sp. RSH04 TaxID=2305464 RepID=UPI000E58B579|nr:transporter substrate-binding domain-containing protein [Colwellia sp. RSH04]RHW76122.1 hypothetical protein D1094_10715 [Colwellia sp. RSH04]
MNFKLIFILSIIAFTPFSFAKTDYITACIDDYPPYQFVGPTPHGIHITGLEKLATTLNKTLRFVASPNFARCVRLLKNGQVDVIAGLNKSKEREAFAFYAPYTIEEELVVIAKKEIDIINYQSIQDKIIGVPRGTTYFRKFNEDSSLNKIEVQSVRIGIEMILKDRIDIIITSINVSNLLINDLKKAQLKTTVIERSDNKDNVSYFGFSKRNKLNLSQQEIIALTTTAFNQGIFKKQTKHNE